MRSQPCVVHPTIPTRRSCSACGFGVCHQCAEVTMRRGLCPVCARRAASLEERLILVREFALPSVLSLMALVAVTGFLINRAAVINKNVENHKLAMSLVESDVYTSAALQPRQLIESPLDELPVETLAQMSPGNLDTPLQKMSDPEADQSLLWIPTREIVVEVKRPALKTRKIKNKPLHVTRPAPKDQLNQHFVGENPFTKYNLDSLPLRPKDVVLTFDGDHLANCVEPILRVLNEKDVLATIFLTGQFIQRYPDATLSILAEGHEIGNHTWSHRHLTQYEKNRTHATLPAINQGVLASELARTREIFSEVTQTHLQPFWRAPFGEHNKSIRTWAYAEGFLHIGWSQGFDSMDWMTNPKSRYYLRPDQLKQRLLEKLKRSESAGKVILFHLGSQRPDEDRPYHMLADFIDEARSKGYRFTTVGQSLSEMMGKPEVAARVRMEGMAIPNTDF